MSWFGECIFGVLKGVYAYSKISGIQINGRLRPSILNEGV